MRHLQGFVTSPRKRSFTKFPSARPSWTSLSGLLHAPFISPHRLYLNSHPRWRKIFERVYSLSLEYDGCGVGRILLNDFIIGLDCPPEDLAFVI